MIHYVNKCSTLFFLLDTRFHILANNSEGFQFFFKSTGILAVENWQVLFKLLSPSPYSFQSDLEMK